MKQVEFVVGREWQHDVRYLDELRPYRPADSRPNLAEIGDIIDLVVGAKNITASVSEESIFPFVADLCEGLIEIAAGRRQKAIIEFRREAWELVLVPDGEAIALSLYSLDDECRVVAHDVRVDANQLVRVVADAARQLLRDLFDISDTFGSDPFVRRFSANVGKMKRLEKGALALRDPEATHERAGSTSTSSGLTLSYAFDVGGPGITEYGGEHPYDLHSMLVPGYVCCEWDGHEVVFCDDYPLLALRGILQRARELFNALESERRTFECDDTIPRGVLDVVGRGAVWHLVVGSKETLELALGREEVLECLISLAELMIDDFEDANPRMQLNQRFTVMREEVDSLRAWLGDFGESNTYFDQPEEYLRENGNVRPADDEPVTATFAWPFAHVRRLHPRAAWRFEDEHIHFSSITTTNRRSFVPTSSALHVLDTESGQTEWSITDSQPSSYAICGDSIVVAHAGGDVTVRDTQTGERYATVEEVGTFLLDAAFYSRSDLIVAADFHGRITGFRRGSGNVVWRHREEDTYFAGAIFEGPLVCALSVTGYLSAFNPLDGGSLWRVRIGGTPEGQPQFHRGRIYAFSHDEGSRSLSVHAVYPYTGRVAWQLRLDGWIAGTPTFLGDMLMLPVERYGRIALHAIPLEELRPDSKWSLELTSAGLDKPTPVCGFELDGQPHGVIRTDRSDMLAFRLVDGEVAWRVQTDPQTTLLYRNVDVSIVRRSVISVGESIQIRDLDTGELQHRFAGVMIAPEYAAAVGQLGVIVGEPGADEGYPDELIRHEIGHFLAVVR